MAKLKKGLARTEIAVQSAINDVLVMIDAEPKSMAVLKEQILEKFGKVKNVKESEETPKGESTEESKDKTKETSTSANKGESK